MPTSSLQVDGESGFTVDPVITYAAEFTFDGVATFSGGILYPVLITSPVEVDAVATVTWVAEVDGKVLSSVHADATSGVTWGFDGPIGGLLVAEGVSGFRIQHVAVHYAATFEADAVSGFRLKNVAPLSDNLPIAVALGWRADLHTAPLDPAGP